MNVYEIKAVNGEPKEWQSNYGPMLTYKLDLEVDGRLERGVELNRKPESRAPAVGERVAGHLESGKYGDKLKIDFEATKELGQSSRASTETSTGSKSSWQPESERDPERSARILRQHSQEMVLRWFALGRDLPAGVRQLAPIIDWFDQDVITAGQAAIQGAGASASSTQEAPGRDPAPDSPPADTHQYLCKLLGDAALNPDAAHTLAGFITEKFSEEQRKRAENGLKDLDTQGDTLSKLRVAYEKATGQLLPDPADDPDIPF